MVEGKRRKMVVENLERVWNEKIEQGKEEAKKECKIEIAKKLLKRGMKIKDIQEITELAKECIKKIKSQLNI